MGMLRKMLSVPTAGLIDFRSDKERIARTSRKTSKQAKAQTKIMQKQFEMQERMAKQAKRMPS